MPIGKWAELCILLFSGTSDDGQRGGSPAYCEFRCYQRGDGASSRLAARLKADHPSYWPETIRALMVHSAEWTQAMYQRLQATEGLREKQRLARCFGYGVPSYQRATASAKEHLALVAQQTIQPFRKKITIKDGKKQHSIGFNECHYYRLPWPKALLEQYADSDFIVKVTLSYFTEPNPGRAAAIDPQKYQSFGLRFDLKRSQETEIQFRTGITRRRFSRPDWLRRNVRAIRVGIRFQQHICRVGAL